MRYDSAAAVADDLQAHPVRHLIDGKLVDSDARADVIDPATARPCATAPSASMAQLEEAVAAAKRSQPAWGNIPVAERRRQLRSLGETLRSHADRLAALLTLEQGRSLAQTKGEVLRAATLLDALIDIPIDDDVLRDDSSGKVYVRHLPLGVVGAIVPWNVPIGLAVPKIVHALYTGNTIVLKPSPFTPLATLRLGELAAGLFPAGVLNIINGGDDIGEAMCTHPDVAKISLTGSVATGRRVMASASTTLKRLTLELGGNDACIVRADADIAAIAQSLFTAAFVNSGQVCMAIKRLYVHESLHDELAERLAAIADRVKVGGGFDPASELGPVQNINQFNSVRNVLEEVRANARAKVLAGGDANYGEGYFVSPTIVTGLAEGTTLVDLETFGPVLPIMRFSTDEEAIRRANGGRLGLGASVWGRDVAAAEAVARCLVAGTIWINRHVGVDPCVPFGGARESGVGRQFGREGLLGFTEPAAIFVPG